jgi:hypothetical protein
MTRRECASVRPPVGRVRIARLGRQSPLGLAKSAHQIATSAVGRPVALLIECRHGSTRDRYLRAAAGPAGLVFSSGAVTTGPLIHHPFQGACSTNADAVDEREMRPAGGESVIMLSTGAVVVGGFARRRRTRARNRSSPLVVRWGRV